MRYVFDLDGTLCTNTNGNYTEAAPLAENIARVNSLYRDGHEIVIFTARGMGTFRGKRIFAIMRWRRFTSKQLKDWGVLYNHLILGKPSGDIYIDDKGESAEKFFFSKV